MAPQAIQDKHRELGPFKYEPTPPPDNINRTVARINYEDGGGYQGEVDDDGRPDGRGILLLPSRYFYEGYFKAGKLNGLGRRIKVDTTLCQGEWVGNVGHGYLANHWPNDDHYEGFYYQGDRHVYGKFTYADGKVY